MAGAERPNPENRREIWFGWSNMEKAAAFFFSLALISAAGVYIDTVRGSGEHTSGYGKEIIIFGVIAAGLLAGDRIIRSRTRKPPTE